MAPVTMVATPAPYPQGAASGRRSIEEVARLAKEGSDSPIVIAWTSHCIREAGARTELERAKALHEGVQKQLVYVPDPQGQERMTGAHLTLGDVIVMEDCDGHAIAFLAACRAAAVRCVAIGHGYDPSLRIGHVLGGVYCEGTWHYADQSPIGERHLPFGAWPTTPTWEYVIDVFTGKPICDARACLHPGSPVKPGLITDPGYFLGVNGPPMDALPNNVGDEWTAFMASQKAEVSNAWNALQAAQLRLRKVTADAGYPLPDPPAGEGSSPKIGWSQADDQNLAQTAAMVDVLVRALDDVVTGKRRIFPVNAQGVSDPAGTDVGIELLPSDTAKLLPAGSVPSYPASFGGLQSPVLADAKTGQPVGVGLSPWIIGGGLALAAVATIAISQNVKAICGLGEVVSNNARTVVITLATEGLVATGKATPEQAAALAKTVSDGTNQQIKNQTDLEAERNKGNEWWKPLLYVGGGALLLWGIYEVWKQMSASSHAKPAKEFKKNPAKALPAKRRHPRRLAA